MYGSMLKYSAYLYNTQRVYLFVEVVLDLKILVTTHSRKLEWKSGGPNPIPSPYGSVLKSGALVSTPLNIQ